jgi:MFS family permease
MHDAGTSSGGVDGSGRAGVTQAPGWTPWRTVVGFGVVSLTADMVYEGGRSVYGPLLASLGGSALVVGLVTGAGETAALVLRVAFGPMADRTGRYWSLTLAGYALTAVCVPLLAVTPRLGGAGLATAAVLILAERTGKAVRSPAKSALLAGAASQVGMGRGLGVHKALDQVGAFAGPLLVAAVIATAGAIWPAMLVLAAPGAAALALLVLIRARASDEAPRRARSERGEPSAEADQRSSPAERSAARSATRHRLPAAWGTDLPRRFFLFALAAGATTAGLLTFGIIGFHLTASGLLPVAAVPLVYAAAMGMEAIAALGTGWGYDRVGGRVLLALPAMVALVPPLALAGRLVPVVVGVLVWGAATGVQDSTVKALVADLVPVPRRATAYGVFAAIQGAAALLGGGLAGFLYETSIPVLVLAVAGMQAVALVVLLVALRERPPVVVR